MPLSLYNTLTNRQELFTPADPARVTFYTCGPTVYDYAHIGNFRSFLAADVLRRFIESPMCEVSIEDPVRRAGPPGAGPAGSTGGTPVPRGTHAGPRSVVHVMNITDVGHMTDDAEGGESGEDRMAVAGKRLLEAKKSGTLPAGVTLDPSDPYQIARFYEDAFREDSRKLGLRVILEADADPTLTPRATRHVEGMKLVIRALLDRGFAYAGGEPGSRAIYFDVQKFPAYGRLSGNTLEKLRAGEGGRVSASHQAQKRHPADFLLWKEDPSHVMKWDSPAHPSLGGWGQGYPGWHIECTVMSAERLLGEGAFRELLASHRAGPAIIDLHSGGEDNIFPHHECEIAQSCCAFGADASRGTFARHWFHPRFLLVEGTKMSKSKGNFFTVRDILEKGVEPAALRLELIRTHYRTNANFTMQGLSDSQRMVERWRRFASRGASAPGPASPAATRARDEFARAMHDDLNVAGAIAAVNTLVGEIDAPTAGDAGVLRELDAVLGVLSLAAPKATTSEIGVFVGVTPDASVESLLRERRDARARKDFARSDAIRDQLAGMGYAIKDAPGGKVEVTRK